MFINNLVLIKYMANKNEEISCILKKVQTDPKNLMQAPSAGFYSKLNPPRS